MSPLTAAEVDEIRRALPAVQSTAYLNAGTLGPMPSAAIDAMRAEHEFDALVRQDALLWERLADVQADARGAIASLTGVATDQVSLMHSTHEGVNTCLWGVDVAPGDRVVTTVEEHPGLLVPLRHLRDARGVDVRIAPWASDDDAFVDGVVGLVDERTRAVALSHVSWVTGRVAPLRSLRAALPDDVRIIVDGAQAAGVLAVDPSDGWDAYTVSGQKWPCGPNGSGGLALVDPEAWRPTFGGYLQVEDPVSSLTSTVRPDGRRFETSQEAMAPLVGLAASVGWLVRDVGLWRAEGHARWLNARARAQLEAAEIGATGDAHLLVVDVANGSAVELVAHLAAIGISTRSLGDSRVRLSLGVWTTPEEVDRCIATIIEHAA